MAGRAWLEAKAAKAEREFNASGVMSTVTYRETVRRRPRESRRKGEQVHWPTLHLQKGLRLNQRG